MTTSEKRAPRAQTSTTTGRESQIETARAGLEKLKSRITPTTEMSIKQAVTALRPDIMSARAKGVAWADIHKTIVAADIKVSLATMKSYLQPGRIGRIAAKEASTESKPMLAPIAETTAAEAAPAIQPDAVVNADVEPTTATVLTSRGRQTGRKTANAGARKTAKKRDEEQVNA